MPGVPSPRGNTLSSWLSLIHPGDVATAVVRDTANGWEHWGEELNSCLSLTGTLRSSYRETPDRQPSTGRRGLSVARLAGGDDSHSNGVTHQAGQIVNVEAAHELGPVGFHRLDGQTEA